MTGSAPATSAAKALLDQLRALGPETDPTETFAELETLAGPELLADLLGSLQDEDSSELSWAVFYLAESMDDAYLEAVLDTLVEFAQRAPGWTDTALIRIWNTHGDPEDCTEAFHRLAKQRSLATRSLLMEKAANLLADPDATPEQCTALRAALDALAARG